MVYIRIEIYIVVFQIFFNQVYDGFIILCIYVLNYFLVNMYVCVCPYHIYGHKQLILLISTEIIA